MENQKAQRTRVTISIDFNEAQDLRDLVLAAAAGYKISQTIAKRLVEQFETDRTITNGVHDAVFGAERTNLKKEEV